MGGHVNGGGRAAQAGGGGGVYQKSPLCEVVPNASCSVASFPGSQGTERTFRTRELGLLVPRLRELGAGLSVLPVFKTFLQIKKKEHNIEKSLSPTKKPPQNATEIKNQRASLCGSPPVGGPGCRCCRSQCFPELPKLVPRRTPPGPPRQPLSDTCASREGHPTLPPLPRDDGRP